jgi:hypothetical protein
MICLSRRKSVGRSQHLPNQPSYLLCQMPLTAGVIADEEQSLLLSPSENSASSGSRQLLI